MSCSSLNFHVPLARVLNSMSTYVHAVVQAARVSRAKVDRSTVENWLLPLSQSSHKKTGISSSGCRLEQMKNNMMLFSSQVNYRWISMKNKSWLE